MAIAPRGALPHRRRGCLVSAAGHRRASSCRAGRDDPAGRYEDREALRGIDLKIPAGTTLAVVGRVGAGKTTLINILCGTLTPDSGTIRLGSNLQMATLDQQRGQLDGHATLKDALTGGGEMLSVNGKARHVVGYMKDFLFLPEQARTPVSVLSGGERGRLMLARALARPSNLLVLDEPTNDLDLATRIATPSTCCRRPLPIMGARCCWGAMTATFLTAWQRR